MTLYGYFRCSTTEQHEERQIRALKDANCQVIRGDKITGTSDFNSRPELTALLNEMESGSTLVLSELSRLSRSFIGMVNEVSKLLERGMHIKTLDGRLDTTAMPKEITMLIVSILGYAASQELEQIKTRTAEGRSVALSKGVKFGAKRKYDKYQIQEIMHKRDLGQGYGQIAKAMGMSRSTVSTIVKRELNAVVGIQ
ncbi:recombinase family protein [Prochlorococcus sp. AH-716-K03]|nr:recombinase family protein [Prochlorococcus sp. AH-716-K03]